MNILQDNPDFKDVYGVIQETERYVGQSGRKKCKKWILKIFSKKINNQLNSEKLNNANNQSDYLNPITNWNASKNTMKQVHIIFENKEEAISFANKNKIQFKEMRAPSEKPRNRKYAENFSSNLRKIV